VFVGYGVVAPEYNWNDYAGVDVKGKTVVILINDPGNEDANPDPNFFKGKAMTYYGRWTYKYEEAARQGAAAAIIVHETAPAAYGWQVVRNSNSGNKSWLDAKDKNASMVPIEGWITLDTAKDLFKRAGLDYEQLKAAANKPRLQGRADERRSAIGGNAFDHQPASTPATSWAWSRQQASRSISFCIRRIGIIWA
jgi:Zn-dependent M28 family amino/carboxypeptidase